MEVGEEGMSTPALSTWPTYAVEHHAVLLQLFLFGCLSLNALNKTKTKKMTDTPPPPTPHQGKTVERARVLTKL